MLGLPACRIMCFRTASTAKPTALMRCVCLELTEMRPFACENVLTHAASHVAPCSLQPVSDFC